VVPNKPRENGNLKSVPETIFPKKLQKIISNLNPRYWIDPKLKPDRMSNKGRSAGKAIKCERRDYSKSLENLFYLFRFEIPWMGFEVKNGQKHLRPYLKELVLLEKTFLDFYLQSPPRSITECDLRIRERLRSYPKHFPILLNYWLFLKEVVEDGRILELFHQCPYCKGIYISRKRGRFDSDLCKKAFESENRGPEDMRRYREKKSQKTED
jgi:hypothetical protein